VKENRQGCLSRSINTFFLTFTSSEKRRQLVRNTFFDKLKGAMPVWTLHLFLIEYKTLCCCVPGREVPEYQQQTDRRGHRSGFPEADKHPPVLRLC